MYAVVNSPCLVLLQHCVLILLFPLQTLQAVSLKLEAKRWRLQDTRENCAWKQEDAFLEAPWVEI